MRYEKLKESASRAASALPCSVALAGLLCGALLCARHGGFMAAVAAASFLAVFLLLGAKRFAVFAVAALLGALSAWLNGRVSESDLLAAIGGRASCGAMLEARVADESVCGPSLPWMPNPKFVKMEARRVSLDRGSSWAQASGLLAVRLPDSIRPEYGDVLRLDGAFLTPEAPASEASFDFGRYLELRAIRRTFDAREAASLSRGSGFMRALLDFRGFALERICEGVRSDEAKRLVAALSFGCQQGVSWESRADFLKSGAIHILSVSGLHVAMVAALLALALRPLPFRLRYALLPLPVLLYVLMTGLQAPSFRAFAMLAVWSLLRAALLCTSAVNSVLLAASLLLLWRPSQIFDQGFQYSFITVVLLIGSASLFKDWRACALESFKWIPSGRASLWSRLRTKALEAFAVSLASCVVAWLASCGLSLLYQGLGVPSSIFANMALIPITWGVFSLLSLQGVLFWIPGFLGFSGRIMELLLGAMNWTCSFFASSGGGSAPMPPAWSVALFLLALLALTAFRKRAAALPLAFAVALALSLWFAQGFFMKPTLVALHGGPSQEPSILLSDPRDGFAVLVNAPDFDSARQASSHLRSQGIAKLDCAVFSSAAKTHCGGAKALLGFLKTERVALPRPSPNALSAAEAVSLAAASGAEVRELNGKGGAFSFSAPLLEARLSKNAWTLECRRPGMDIAVSLEDLGGGVRVLEARGPDGALLLSAKLLNSLERELLAFELDPR